MRVDASLRLWRTLAVVVGLCALGLGLARADEATPIAGWMHYEQKLLSRALDDSKIIALANKQDPRFAPEQARTFAIRSYWIDEDKLDAFTGTGLPPRLSSLFFRERDGRRQVRLLVHPESEKFYAKLTAGAERAEDFRASSTASSRTLLVWPGGRPDAAFFAKLSLDKEVGGVVRTIPRGEVARSIGVNDILHADQAHLPAGFKFLPEQLGVMPRGMERGGMIIRTIPDEVLRGEVEYVPLFSLYAKPAAGGAPLLARMIEKSGMPADEFIRERILRPFVRQWVALSVGRGITSEAHAQNVLLEVGKDGLPTGAFVHRDFGGFNVDLAFRRARKLPSPTLPVIQSLDDDYHQAFHDQALDQSLGTYFVGGFLFNLDRELPRWQRAGWVSQAAGRPAAGRYTAMLKSELALELRRVTGKVVRIGDDLALSGRVRGLRNVRPGVRVTRALRSLWAGKGGGR